MDLTDAPQTAAELEYRPTAAIDVGFVLSTWSQSLMRSPGMPAPTAELRRQVSPVIKTLLNRPDVWVVGAYGEFESNPNAIIGWLAWTPGQLPAVHYSYVRGPWRMRGVFSRLLQEAMVGRRWIYTMRGSLPKYGRRKALSRDKVLIDALAKRGVYGTFVDLGAWMEKMQ